MAQALGYVTKTETGNFSGTLNLGGANRINIVANDNKETDKQPDFRIVDSRGQELGGGWFKTCLLYTSPSPRDRTRSRMPSSA